MWRRFIWLIDEHVNHLNPFNRPWSRRLCDYNDRLLTGQRRSR